MTKITTARKYATRSLPPGATEKLLLATNWLEVTYFGAKLLIYKQLVETRNYNKVTGTIEIRRKAS